jgi:N-methylhydantoinase A
MPGPACYGRGGDLATVTDANVVLGRLRVDAFLGGAMTLDRDAASAAVGRLAAELGLGLDEVAAGILRIANEHMAQALRVISIQRGVDPRDHTLVSFGGAGGLHVCALADALSMPKALVPVHAGVLSALGMIAAPHSRDLSHTLVGPLAGFSDAQLEQAFARLRADGARQLAGEGVGDAQISEQRSLDLRYQGQSFTLNVAWQGAAVSAEAFHGEHQKRYGHRLDHAVELVNLRVGLQGPPPPISLAALPSADHGEPLRWVEVSGEQGDVPVYVREQLAPLQCIDGPALITETVSTTWVAAGWRCCVEPFGNLMLERR